MGASGELEPWHLPPVSIQGHGVLIPSAHGGGEQPEGIQQECHCPTGCMSETIQQVAATLEGSHPDPSVL